MWSERERAGIWARCVDDEVIAVVAGHEADEHVKAVAKGGGVWLVLDGSAIPPVEC